MTSSSAAATKSIQTKTLKTGQRVYYSLTQKQSQSKISFNLRLLILVEEKYLGYISQKDINRKDIEASIDLNKIKKKVYLKDIRRIMNMSKDKSVSITINDVDKDNKPISLKWVFKMENLKLAQSWVELLDKQNSPHPSRKTTEHKQEDKSVKNISLLKQNEKKQEIQKNMKKKIQDQEQRNLQDQKIKQKQQQLLKQKQKQIQKQKQKQKQKQQEKVNLKQVQSTNQKQKLFKNQQEIQKKQISDEKSAQKYQKPQQKNIIQLKKVPNRQSDVSFSFKGAHESNNILNSQSQQYSPIKRQQQIIAPHPILHKLKTYQSNLSEHLQQKVDLKKISKQILQHKQQKQQKLKLKQKQKPIQFKQLSQNLTNRQKQLQDSNFTNYFRQCFGQIDQKKYMDFYSFVEIKIRQLLTLHINKIDGSIIKAFTQNMKLKNGVTIQILPSQLKQLPGNNNICDQDLMKSYLNKLKNQDYIWKIISNDLALSKIFLIPMSCIVEFQGVIAYFSCVFQPQNIQQNIQRSKSQDFSSYFQRLSQLTMINRSTLQNSNYIKFTKFSSNNFVISQINQFLPRLMVSNKLIRPEMFVESMVQISQNQRSYSIKISKKQEDQQNRYFKNSIQKSIQVISKSLERLEDYIIHPSQFSELIHSYGLNIVNLNQIYKKVQNTFIRSIIKTQVALRSIKTLFRKKLQQIILQPQPNQKKQNPSLQSIAKTLINILLSKPTQSSAQLWKLVTLHSQVNFKLPVQRTQINKGYLLLGLQHYLGLNIQSNYSSCQKIGNVDTFVQKIQFIIKIKISKLYWLDKQIQGLELSQAAKKLVSKFNFKQKQLPFYIFQDKTLTQKIYEIISIYYSPINSQIKNIHLYRDCQLSTQHTLPYFRRKIAEIKWLIKSSSEQNTNITTSPEFLNFIQQKLQTLKYPLLFYYPQFHPFYTQIYDLLISLNQYSVSPSSLQKIQELSKISMSNMIQLCGGNTMHIKLTNNYYQKGQLYQKWGKIQESIGSYKKAKNILQVNQFTKSKQYAMVQLKLSQLYLIRGKDGEAWGLLNGCYEIFCQLIGVESNQNAISQSSSYKYAQEKLSNPQSLSEDQQQQVYNHITKSLQLLNRCSSSYSPSKSSILLSHSLTILQFFLQPSDNINQIQISDLHFVQLLKLLIQNYFILHSRQIIKQFFIYIQMICDQLYIGGARMGDFNTAAIFIKQLIINRIFIEVINGFAGKSKYQLENRKNKKNINVNMNMNKKEDRKNQNYQKLIKSLIILLGEGFILGMMNEQNI